LTSLIKHYVYSKGYYADLGENHPFPMEKSRLLYEHCLAQGLINTGQVAEPSPVGRQNLLLVHTQAYLDRLALLSKNGLGMLGNGENPVSQEICTAAELVCGGSYLAGCLALAGGFAMSFSGGFHHAFPDHEEGFCYFNDVAVAIRMLQAEGKLSKALVVDCDLHQGNGTAHIFNDEPNVFTASIHQEDNYPEKQVSDLDVGLYGKETADKHSWSSIWPLLQKAYGYE
jgi:acetoin utilization deacetylase AcuC-like enzyme